MALPIRRISLVAVVVAAVAAAAWYWTRPEPVAVAVATVDRGTVEATVSNTRAGTVKACRRAKLAPASGGQIARLPVRKGDAVKRGQLLLELWNDDLSAQVLLAESAAAASRAGVEEACIVADNAAREAERLATLRKQGLAPVEAAEQAQTQAESQRARCKAARANAATSAAQVAAARATLERTLLKAPFDGRVAEINGELGEFVTPSPLGVATLPTVDLVDTSCLYVSAPIDEADAPAIKTGLEARIRVDAFPGKPFAGRIKRIAPYILELEKQARTVEVEALFADPAEYSRLLPGYSADVEIVLESRQDVLRVPTEAILEGNRVLVFAPSTRTLEERTFQRGLANWRYTEVLSGLRAGDQVVTSIDREGVKAGAAATVETSSPATRKP